MAHIREGVEVRRTSYIEDAAPPILHAGGSEVTWSADSYKNLNVYQGGNIVATYAEGEWSSVHRVKEAVDGE